MAPLPVFKFIFLGIRQLTKPMAKHVIAKANAKRGITHKMCIGLGRISLGLSGVITEWSDNEMRRQSESEQKAAGNPKVADTVPNLESETGKLGGESPSRGKAAQRSEVIARNDLDIPQGMKAKKAVNVIASATPRSRSLLEVLTHGPRPKESDTYDSKIFVNPRILAGGAARIFIHKSYQSAWAVFRVTFLSPFPEERLVSAGVDLLIELLAYFVLASLLFWELSIQVKANAAKEARIDELEQKLNRLMNKMDLDSQNDIINVTPVQILNSAEGLLNSEILLCTGQVRCNRHGSRY